MRKTKFLTMLLALSLTLPVAGCSFDFSSIFGGTNNSESVSTESTPNESPDDGSAGGGSVEAEKYTITAVAQKVNDVIVGEVTGGGVYDEGEEVTLRATVNKGYEIVGWYEGDTLVQAGAIFTFTASKDATYTAVFAHAVENADLTNASFGFTERTTDASANYWDGLSGLEEGTYSVGQQDEVKTSGSLTSYAIKVDALDPDGDGKGRYPESSGWAGWNQIDAWYTADIVFDEVMDLTNSTVSIDVKTDNMSKQLSIQAATLDYSEAEAGDKLAEKAPSIIAGQNGNGIAEAGLTEYVNVIDLGDGWSRVQYNFAGIYNSDDRLEGIKVIRFGVTTMNMGVDTKNESPLDYTEDMAIYFDNLQIIDNAEPVDAESVADLTASPMSYAEITGAASSDIVKAPVFGTESDVGYIKGDGSQNVSVKIPFDATIDGTASLAIYAKGSVSVNGVAHEINGWKNISLALSGAEEISLDFGSLNGYALVGNIDWAATAQYITYDAEACTTDATAATVGTGVVAHEFLLIDGCDKYVYNFTLNMGGNLSGEDNGHLRKIEFFANGALTFWGSQGIQIGARQDIAFLFSSHNGWAGEICNTWGSALQNGWNKGSDIALSLTVEYIGEQTKITLSNQNDETQFVSVTVDGKVSLGNKTVAAYCPTGTTITIK